jgi:transglutaminase-like putative cysteine protease
MRYRIIHRTTYRYQSPVTICHYLARLAPRALPGQDCPWHEVHIHPKPVERATRMDSFGNTTLYFEIEGSHTKLEVLARSLVEVSAYQPTAPHQSPPWEQVRDTACHTLLQHDNSPCALTFPSPLIPYDPTYASYARLAFTPNRPILEALCELNRKIFTEFTFDSTATDVATPISRVFAQRRGVCQDFAQVMIACLRAIGLPARYVSGYLETLPPPGQKKLVGSDASHAWVSLFCGHDIGWVDADPTNNILPSDRHVTVAWGRDFQDVSPLRGVTLGAGDQRLEVAVDVLPEAGDS